MSRRGHLSLLGELAIRQLQDEARRDLRFVDDDVSNPPDCSGINLYSIRLALGE